MNGAKSRLKYLILFSILDFGFLYSSAQQEKVILKSEKWNYKEKGMFRYSILLQDSPKDSVVLLRNGDTLHKYNYFFANLQTVPTEHGFNQPLRIMVGDDKKANMVVVVDKNFNGSFSDDSVYLVSLIDGITNAESYYKKLPEVTIDSIKLKDNVNTTQYLSLSLTLSAGAVGIDYFKDYQQFTQASKYMIDVFVDTYLSGKYVVNSTEYEICLVPHPFVAPFFTLPNLKYNTTRMFLNVFKRIEGKRDSLVQSVIFQAMIEPNEKKRFLTIENKKYAVTEYNFGSNFIKLVEVSSPSPEVRIHGFTAHLINTGRKNKVDFGSAAKDYNVIMFSGSWCIPCHEAQPAFENLVRQFSGKASFFTVTNEQNTGDAVKYYRKVKPTWDFYYEKLSSEAPNDLTRRLNVTAFPSFFLINKAGEIIYKGSSSKAIIEIQKYLSQIK